MSYVGTFPTPTDDTIKARLARLASPGFSYCLRCGMPWSRVEPHTTLYGSRGSGCFPLCEVCWRALGHPEARIEYYATLIEEWARYKPVDVETRIVIQRAVANERRT